MKDTLKACLRTKSQGDYEFWLREGDGLIKFIVPVVRTRGTIFIAKEAHIRGLFSKRIELVTTDQHGEDHVFAIPLKAIPDARTAKSVADYCGMVMMLESTTVMMPLALAFTPLRNSEDVPRILVSLDTQGMFNLSAELVPAEIYAEFWHPGETLTKTLEWLRRLELEIHSADLTHIPAEICSKLSAILDRTKRAREKLELRIDQLNRAEMEDSSADPLSIETAAKHLLADDTDDDKDDENAEVFESSGTAALRRFAYELARVELRAEIASTLPEFQATIARLIELEREIHDFALGSDSSAPRSGIDSILAQIASAREVIESRYGRLSRAAAEGRFDEALKAEIIASSDDDDDFDDDDDEEAKPTWPRKPSISP